MASAAAPPRSYQDPCGIAGALDRVGERWALLIVRELCFGAKRFGDLRAGLPGASPNVVSQRLRELEQGGVVAQRKLDPPANAWVYELTPWGRELEAVLDALARWGSRATPTPKGELSAAALLLALKTTFDPALAGDLRASFDLGLDGDRYRVDVRPGSFAVTRGRADRAEATIETDPTTLRRVVYGDRSLTDALAQALRIEGSRASALRLLRSFRRPTLAPSATPRR